MNPDKNILYKQKESKVWMSADGGNPLLRYRSAGCFCIIQTIIPNVTCSTDAARFSSGPFDSLSFCLTRTHSAFPRWKSRLSGAFGQSVQRIFYAQREWPMTAAVTLTPRTVTNERRRDIYRAHSNQWLTRTIPYTFHIFFQYIFQQDV